MYLHGSGGAMVPLGAVASIRRGTMPEVINHSGQIPAITISFDVAPGKALSDAVKGVQEATRAIRLPADLQGSFAGTAAAFQSSTANMGWLLLLALIVVYIILGILYESFIHPITILSGLPSAAVGALLTLYLFHLPLTLYAFVGMIMLIGIVKKNAIMMIDFALERQRGDASDDPLPPDHDDDDGRPDGHPADRPGHGHGRRLAPAIGPLRGRRPAVLAAVDAVHHAGALRVSG